MQLLWWWVALWGVAGMGARATVVNAALFDGVTNGHMGRVKTALAAGANANGSPEQPCTPIMAATGRDDVDMINILIEHGGDADRPAVRELPCTGLNVTIMPGERALHIAVVRGNTNTIRFLLKRAHADPNAAGERGWTPLLMAAATLHNSVAVVRLLLEAGADPALADEDGYTPLHVVAQHNFINLVDMLYTASPTVLNCYTHHGETPLFMACSRGHEGMASRLLSLGAMQSMPPDHRNMLPLATAAIIGFEGVVRVLINKGMRAVGGTETLHFAIFGAIQHRQTKILQLLLAADGSEKRSHWANIKVDGKRLLHHAAGYYWCPAAVNILLAAGADEAALDSMGRIPRDTIGVDVGKEQPMMNGGNEVAIRRMLEHGPAYRARSWAWPAEETGDALVSSPQASPKAPVNVRIFRSKSDRKFFVRLVTSRQQVRVEVGIFYLCQES